MVSNSPILRTLIYSDIFDFPLTKEEIWKFLIAKKISKESFEKELNRLVKFEATPLGCNHNLYYLFDRKEIAEKRIKRKKESHKKLDFARKIIQKLYLVPTVLFIGVSGGLALENAEKDDDIDLFVITSKNTLWTTRLILVFLLIIMGQYRGRGKKESAKICLNMLVSEEALAFPKNRHDLYTAHEIVQLRPIFNKNNTYNKFLTANRWIDKFLPNAIDRIKNYESRIKNRQKKSLFIIHYSLFIFEQLAQFFQLWYMKGHRTTETINGSMLAFHPFEYKNYVLEEYNKRLKRYEI